MTRTVAAVCALLVSAACESHVALPVLTLTKWTGADFPGTPASTFRYRLTVKGPPRQTIVLSTRGLRKGWIAAFCADQLCAPDSVTFTVPASGLKTYEFQLVPPAPGAQPGRVMVGANDAAWTPTPNS